MVTRPKIILLIVLNVFKILIVGGSDVKFMIDRDNSTLLNRPGIKFMKNNLLYLSELPLEKLLQVKNSLNELREQTSQEDYNIEDDFLESRMLNDEVAYSSMFGSESRKSGNTLAENKKINRKTGYGAVEDPWDSKPSKVQTFFQISITALAFLAFAGYLLCMIVQAIKTKGTMFMYPNSLNMVNSANTMNSIVNAGAVPLIRKRRPLGRKRRNVFLSNDYHNDTNFLANDDSFLDINPAEMYNVMLQGAEDYSKLYLIQ